MTNPLIDQTKQAIMQKSDERIRPVIEKVVAAGEKTMYAPSTREMTLQQLGDGTDPEKIGAGVAKLLGILYNQSRNTIPMQAMIPASIILLCEGLQFLEDGGARTIDADFLSQCTQATASNLLQLFGVTPDKLQSMIGQAAPGGSQPNAAPPAPGAEGGVPVAPAQPAGIVGAAQGVA